MHDTIFYIIQRYLWFVTSFIRTPCPQCSPLNLFKAKSGRKAWITLQSLIIAVHQGCYVLFMTSLWSKGQLHLSLLRYNCNYCFRRFNNRWFTSNIKIYIELNEIKSFSSLLDISSMLRMLENLNQHIYIFFVYILVFSRWISFYKVIALIREITRQTTRPTILSKCTCLS